MRRQCALDRCKAALEFLVGLPQQRFRVGVQMAGEIDGGEQEIANFGRCTCIVAVERSFDLVGLFANFAQDRARIVPIEADPARLGLKLQSAGEGG